jgi:hypothetical protein
VEGPWLVSTMVDEPGAPELGARCGRSNGLPRTRPRLYSASTLIAHRLADPDPIVTRAGTIRRAERSHQLDVGGATGMGSLRLQDTYRIDPNDVRSLPPGVAYIVTGGRAAKVAVARGGRAPLAGSPRRDQGDN